MGRVVRWLLAVTVVGVGMLISQVGLALASPDSPAVSAAPVITSAAKAALAATKAVPVKSADGPADSSVGDAILPGFDEATLPANDDFSTGQVSLPFSIDFYGTTYDSLYVNNNGNLTFTQPLGTYTPQSLNQLGLPMIAPFWADVDTRVGPVVTYGTGLVNGHTAFGVNWLNVGCFSEIDSVTDTFQVILISRPDLGSDDWQIEYNYGPLTWDSGQASGGDAQCLGGSAARVGYTSGVGVSCELPGSGVNGGLLDGDSETGLFYHDFNSTTRGRYIFDVSGTTGKPDGCGAYFALGDSYSSGEGAATLSVGYDYAGDPCDRTSNAWPSLLAEQYPAVPPLSGATFRACSGDTIYDILNGTAAEPTSQLQTLQNFALNSAEPGLVTLTGGGNDLGFSDILAGCVYSGESLDDNGAQCAATVGSLRQYLASGEFSHNLTNYYTQVASAVGGTENVVVVGYPNLFPLDSQANELEVTDNCGWWMGAGAARLLPRFESLQAELNAVIQAAANAVGVRFIPLGDVLAGHEMCTNENWINMADLHLRGIGHPDANGQQAIADFVAGKLGYMKGNGTGGNTVGSAHPATGAHAASNSGAGPADSVKRPGTGGSHTESATGTAGAVTAQAVPASAQPTSPAAAARSEAAGAIGIGAGLPGGTVSFPYDGYLWGTNRTVPDTWGVVSGSLPPGLALDPHTPGLIDGIPTKDGTYTFTVEAIDSSSPEQDATATESITIGPETALGITLRHLRDWTADQPGSVTLTAQGGDPAYSWQVTSGFLPAGLSLDPVSGVISGTPTAAGTDTFTVTVTDSSSQASPDTATATYTLTVDPATALLALPAQTLPGAAQGDEYDTQIESTGGVAPLAWSVTSGSLPNGLSLDPATGIISGIPTTAGTFNFGVTVGDAAANSATESLSITITAGSAPSITAQSLPDATARSAYQQSLDATGGVAPETWSVSSGTLPAGLGLDPGTGTISGTPTTVGTYTFGVTLTDSAAPSAQTATASFTIVVDAAPPLPAMTVSDTVTGGTIGNAYQASLIPANGTGPYSYAVTGGALPAGLNLDPSLGIISGTPTTAGTFTATITVTDSSSPAQTATDSISITIAAPVTLAISTTSLADGAVGALYATQVAVTGGTGADAFAVSSGSLPAGLTLDPGTGIIDGTPSAAGTSTFTVTVTDSATPAAGTATATLSLTIAAATQVAVATTSLPDAHQGIAYSQLLAASGGAPPYTWSVISGSLPAGLTLNSGTGVISGTPTGSGTSTFTMQATDSLTPTAQTATQSLTITVHHAASLTIGATTLPRATQGASYSAAIDVSGGVGPYTLSVTSGSLPNGLTLDSSGTLSGEPTDTGVFTFTMQAADSSTPTAQTATHSYTLDVAAAPALVIGTTTLPGATQGDSYDSNLGVTGGVQPYTYSVSSGSLPAGLSLDSSGDISGTLTGSGSSTFTIEVTDGATPTPDVVSQSYTVDVTGPLSVTTTSLPAAIKGTAYSATIAASGGTQPYAFSVSSGSLPSGLTLDSSTGAISGTPTATGTASFTIQVTDNSSTPQTASQALMLTVSAPALTPQAISFTPPASGTYGGTATLSATGGGSGNPVVFSVDSTSGAGVCAVSGTDGTTLTYTGVGNCVVDANQAGNASYSAAPQVTGTIAVGKASQAITFTAPATGTFGGSATLSATGGHSGNPVVFSVDSASGAGVCAVSGTDGTTLTYTGVGSCVVDANQAGSANYSAATQVQRTITVTKAAARVALAITGSPVAYGHEKAVIFKATVTAPAGDPTPTGTLTVTASGKTLCTATLSQGVATCSPGLATLLAPGTYHVTAAYGGNSRYANATSATTTLTVAKETTKTTLTVNETTVSYGKEKTLVITATVTPQFSGTTVVGTVTITAGNVTICKNKALSRGKATCSPAAGKTLPKGTYSIVATYKGNADYASSKSFAKSVKID